MADRVNPPSPEDARRIIARTIKSGASIGRISREIAGDILEALDAAGLRISPKLEDGPKLKQVGWRYRDGSSSTMMCVDPDPDGHAEDCQSSSLEALWVIIDERGEDQ